MTNSQVMLMTPRALWQSTLEQIRLQLPEATFNTLLADSVGTVDANGSLIVCVATPQAKAWVEARLTATVNAALQSTGYSGSVLYQVASTPSPIEPQRSSPHPIERTFNLPTPGPPQLAPGKVAFQFLNYDLYARGWLRTPSYYELFWQPILGHVGYSFWRLMQVLYWNNPSANHTRWVRLDIQDSAAHLGVSRDLIRGKPAMGLGGALETLQTHRLAQINRHEAGRASVYTGRFLRNLPLLTPRQVACLTQTQQQEHLDWLLAAGYEPHEWESVGEPYASFIFPEDEDLPSGILPFTQPRWDKEPLAQTPFIRTPVYYDLYLQPLIGSVAYAIWRVCKVLNGANPGASHTKDTVTSVYALAATLDCHRQKITGVRRRKKGVAYWQDGAFDRLRKERLALIREEGTGNQIAYRLLVVHEPPLLCPAQVESFSENLQQSHTRWLKRAQLQIDDWQQLSMDTLLSIKEANDSEVCQ